MPATASPRAGDRAGAGGRPVLLATLGVPFDQAAVSFAIASAVELGEPLIVAPSRSTLFISVKWSAIATIVLPARARA